MCAPCVPFSLGEGEGGKASAPTMADGISGFVTQVGEAGKSSESTATLACLTHLCDKTIDALQPLLDCLHHNPIPARGQSRLLHHLMMFDCVQP